MATLGNMLKRSHLGGGPSPEPPPTAAEEGSGSQNGGARRGNSVDEKADSTRTSSMSSSQAGGLSSRRESSSAAVADGGEAKRAKAPLVFLSQLDQLLQGCYSCIFDALKKNLTLVLPDCIQAPPPDSPSSPSSPTNTPRHSEQQREQAQQQEGQGQGRQSPIHQQQPPFSELTPHPQPEHQSQQLELPPQHMEQQQQQPQQFEEEQGPNSACAVDEEHGNRHHPGDAQGQHLQQPCSLDSRSKQHELEMQQEQELSLHHHHQQQQQQQQQQQVEQEQPSEGHHQQQQLQQLEQQQQNKKQQQQQQQHRQQESDIVCSHRSQAPGPWVALVDVLQAGMQELRGQHVPRILIKCIFKQILAFINSQLFNQLLLRPECCSASNAQYLLAGLKFLDAWILAGAPGSVPPDASMLKPL
ncbi:hypothetical protein DUNSADRAFT_18589, partial [Dunaliella salina]